MDNAISIDYLHKTAEQAPALGQGNTLVNDSKHHFNNTGKLDVRAYLEYYDLNINQEAHEGFRIIIM